MRVHELAKELAVGSKELMEELKRLKVKVEHHSNTLDEETVRKLKQIYQARRGGGGVVKKITRRAGAELPPSPPPIVPSSAAPPPGAPRLGRRLGAPASPIPPRPPGFGMPHPEGPAMAPVVPPPLRIKPPSTVRPPQPLGRPRAAQPMPSPPLAEAPLASAPAQEAPVAPFTGTGAAPPASRPTLPVRRAPREQPKKRGTTIDLDTFKTVVTGQPPAPPAPGKPGRPTRRRGGEHRHKREAKEIQGEEFIERKFRPSFLLSTPAADKRRDARRGAEAGRGAAQAEAAKPKLATIYGQSTVGDFAQKIGASPADVIKRLMELGEGMTINAVLSDDMAELLAGEFGVSLTIVPETDEYDVRDFVLEDSPEEMIRRPPVVTVMGHVDHGKTTLLDRIRSTHVAEGEAGGITQHIGASCVQTAKGEVTFLDTPGHEAFTAMRARGADATDIVVLVVAANDGIMPQTVEAINHAKAAGVPIIVGINKMDMPGANPERVKQGLMSHGLVPEDFGGETICVPLSAKTGEGIEQLLEMILLQSEVLELQANPRRHGEGVIIESSVEAGRGVAATVLVQKGTLRVGDAFVSGPESGKVRAVLNERGESVEEIGPGHAGEIFGLRGAPEAGESFIVVPNERIAREIAERRSSRRRTAGLSAIPTAALFTDESGALQRQTELKELAVILRGDVQGSVEAVAQSLQRLAAEGVRLEIKHSGIGTITVSDVNLAATTGATIIGFGVRPEAQAAQLAEQEHVAIRLYTIIYELIDDVKAMMGGLLEPTFEEKTQGRAQVRQIFRISRIGNVAGCYVTEGEIHRSHMVRLLRDGAVVTEKRRLASLRRVKDDVSKVSAGLECGMAIEGFNDIKEGDVIETYTLEKVEREVTVTG
jgi:translation initiation factor IF-2